MNSYFFIDGFNLYHSIKKSFNNSKYNWLDLRKFCEQFLEKNEVMKEVLFFTAYSIWDQDKMNRHKTYIQALSYKGVTVVKGRFKKVSKNFNKQMKVLYPKRFVLKGHDKIVFETYEEKETDVNIAIKMFEYAMKKDCQKMYLISADSDLIPAVEAIKRNFPDIKIINILPSDYNKSKVCNLSKNCHDYLKITEDHIKDVLLDDEIRINKNTIIMKPSEWV